jgi:hypothetical protein
MAFVLKNAWVRINSTSDLSASTLDVSVDMSAADVDTTAMGAGGHQRMQGIRDDKFAITALSDFSATGLDSVIWPLFNGGSAFLVEVAANGTLISNTNPKYSGTVILTEYTPISGAVGDAAKTPLTLPVTGVITRGTT